ncbi:hypothetical protein [Blastococcus saxobsidens]|uniref:Uncharacterized protein n=1 Tax=Blastococcus saxobsidens (strain DD2) TaxID=1146883 RepID=H6RVC7_BLASD|nr:hypothetical protein [Blastococcus saxobsidens]CCG02004.1 membrane protein of unknown function [Blastococcus saxobsidens DD2]
MTTTTVPETTAHRRATAGLVGGALWALLPVAWATALADDAGSGTVSLLAAATAWIFLVLPPTLILAGLAALRRALAGDAGRVGAVGTALTATGLAAMAVGNGIEVASITTGGAEVALGHITFLLGFLVSTVGGVLLGVVVARQRRDTLSRAGGLLLALALPLGIGIGALGSIVSPENDAWFWAAISVPAGVAWVLLGRSLQAAPTTHHELVTAS